MKTTKKDFEQEIKDYFTAKTGLTIKEAKNKIKNQILLNEFDTDIRVDNVRLFYTSNDNYGQGIKNGYGKGFYLSSVGFTGGSEIKV